MDKLQAMRSFVRVVEAGSFSAVAAEAGATQSAISKQVAALERELGARLLTRTTRSLAPTEEGARYFEQARRLVAEIAEAESAVRAGEQELTGWLRVAASVGFGRLKLMPLVQSFLARASRRQNRSSPQRWLRRPRRAGNRCRGSSRRVDGQRSGRAPHRNGAAVADGPSQLSAPTAAAGPSRRRRPRTSLITTAWSTRSSPGAIAGA